MKGADIEKYLNSLTHATLLDRDNNDYLISFQLDTGVDVAFDPRTTGKASLFTEKIPMKLLATTSVSINKSYPPANPSTALNRVSSQLSQAKTLYRLEIKDSIALTRLIEWIRWA